MYNPILTREERALLERIVAERARREKLERYIDSDRTQLPMHDSAIPVDYRHERE
jgi:hypothetical protein